MLLLVVKPIEETYSRKEIDEMMPTQEWTDV